LVAPAAALTEAQLDPLASPALRHALPGLVGAFDEQLMREALQAALFGPSRPDLTIERCEIEQATYVPDPCCIIRYVLTLRDSASDTSHELLVSGQVFPNQDACAAYVRAGLGPLVARMAGREEIALFATPVGTIDALHMAVFAFPLDADLPVLMGATDRQALAPLLSAALQGLRGPGFAVEDCRVELVDYGRQQRATLRYRIRGRAAGATTAEDVVVYGKVTGDGSGALAGPISVALREWQPHSPIGYRFNVPQVLAWIPELQLSLLEAIPGESLIGDALKGQLRGKPVAAGPMSLDQMIDACARIAATLHTSGSQLGRRRTFEDELASLRRELAYLQPISPELGARLESWLDEIARVATRSQPLPLCFNHGDYTYGQLLFDGSGSGLVDFDSVCQAEPALDLAQFLTYVRVASLKTKLTPDATRALIEQLGQRFLDTYAGLVGGDARRLAERVAIYKALSLVRRTMRSWQKFKPGRIESALALLEEELAGLPGYVEAED
jgi:hypothetical protein